MRAGLILLALATALAAIGCSEEPTRYSDRHQYFVPFVAMRDGHSPPQANLMLPASDGDVLIARGEKAAYGAVPISGFSSFAIYTRDSQAIYVPGGGSGYRHRWVVQQGISAPIAP